MMFPKSFFTIALVAASAQFASATPPGCLLGAVGSTQPNPADLESICGTNASKVQGQIRSLCGANTGAAMSAFSSICSAAGHHVATPKPSTPKTASSKNPKPPKATHHAPGGNMETKTIRTSIMTASGGAGTGTPTTAGQQAVTTPTAPASSTAPAKYTGTGAAGRVDAESFAALALAAAGLAVFL